MADAVGHGGAPLYDAPQHKIRGRDAAMRQMARDLGWAVRFAGRCRSEMRRRGAVDADALARIVREVDAAR